MKKFFMIMVLAVAGMGVFTSCNKDDVDELGGYDKESLAGRLVNKMWTMDGDTAHHYVFLKNHLAICLWNARTVEGATQYNSVSGVAFGTWRDRNGILCTNFTAGQYVGIAMSKILCGNLTLIHDNGGTMEMEDDDFKAHTLFLEGKYNDNTDDSETDKALQQTWLKRYDVWYVNEDRHVQGDISMSVGKDGMAHFLMRDDNIDFDSRYVTKDGRITFDKYIDDLGKNDTYIYIVEGSALMMFDDKYATYYSVRDAWYDREYYNKFWHQ